MRTSRPSRRPFGSGIAPGKATQEINELVSQRVLARPGSSMHIVLVRHVGTVAPPTESMTHVLPGVCRAQSVGSCIIVLRSQVMIFVPSHVGINIASHAMPLVQDELPFEALHTRPRSAQSCVVAGGINSGGVFGPTIGQDTRTLPSQDSPRFAVQ